MKNSSRFNVLVLNNDQALGTYNITDLLPGQIGFYNAKTNDEITSHSEAQRDGFYIALGLDNDNDGNTDDILKSYNVIYPNKVTDFTQKCATNFRSAIEVFTNCIIGFSTDYMIKIEMYNKSYNLTNNHAPVTFMASYRTEDCLDPATCQHPDIEKMYTSLISQINNDDRFPFISAVACEPATPYTDIVDLATWCSTHPGEAPGIKITIDKPIHTPQLDELYEYTNPREVAFNIIGVAGFEGNYTVEELQSMIYEETIGKEVIELEIEAGGWNSNPGVIRELNAGKKKIRTLANEDTLYNIQTLYWKYASESGVLNYDNDEMIIIATQDGSTTAQLIKERLGTLIADDPNYFTLTNCV